VEYTLLQWSELSQGWKNPTVAGEPYVVQMSLRDASRQSEPEGFLEMTT